MRKYRLKNPLGFQVLSYRVDPDASESPVQDLSSDYLSAGVLPENRGATVQTNSQSNPSLPVENDSSPVPIESGN